MKKGTVAVLSAVFGSLMGAVVGSKLTGRTIEEKSDKIDKFKSYYTMLNQWLILKQSGKSLEKYFIDNGYKSIAIYGMGEMGNRLYDELKNSEVEVKYAIDKNAGSTYINLTVIDINDELEKVDAIIVTPIFAFDEINEELSEIVDYNIISLENIIYDIY